MKRYGVPLPPGIDPLPPGTKRPFVSVMIPAYNYADYMRATLQSVLSQDPGPEAMQIEVVDDCSTRDDPETVTREVGRGRIAFSRQPRNLGMVANFNDCIRRARGEWVHILHGDDVVRPDFYARARQALTAHPEVGAWVCRIVYMDEDGIWTGLSELDARTPGVLPPDFAIREFVTPRIQFVGILVRRAVYEELGGFRPELKICLDWDMWKRVALRTPIFYDPEPLACFRLHCQSAYANAVRSGASVADERKSIDLSSAYLSPELAPRVWRDARKAAAVRAIRTARQQSRLGDHAAARNQIKEALRCSRTPEVWARLLWTVPTMMLGGPQRMPQPPARTINPPPTLPTDIVLPGTPHRPSHA